MARSVPATRNTPSVNSMSATSASSRCAAPAGPSRSPGRRRARWRCPPSLSSATRRSAFPTGTSSLSPSISRTAPGSMPSRRATSGTNVDRWPCPIACTPVRTATLPSARNAGRPVSSRMPPATSRKQPDADAAQLAVALAMRRAGPESRPNRHCSMARVHQRGEIAAVVDRAVRRPVRHGGGRDQVAPPQLRAVDLHRVRRRVDQALDQIEGFRPPGAAIGTERRRVGEHHLGAEVDRRDDIDARQAVLGVAGGDDGRIGRRVGADADPGPHPEREKAAVGVERELALEHAVAARACR